MTNKFPVFKNNSHYRLGDIIFKSGGWAAARNAVFEQDLFQDSLVKSYLKQLKYPLTEGLNLNILTNACLQKSKLIKSRGDVLYINIRLGDVMFRPFWMAKYDKAPQFNKLSEWFIFNHQLLIGKIKKFIKHNPKIRSILFVGVLHFGNMKNIGDWLYSQHDKELNYMLFNGLTRKIKEALPDLKQDIFQVDSSSFITIADTQFLTLLKAKHVILESGRASGFARLIRSLRRNMKL